MIAPRRLPLVKLAGVTHAFAEFELGPVDLEVATGTIHVVLGPNGAGKTTLLDLVCGLRTAAEGTVEIEGREPDPDDAARYRRLGFAPDGEHNLPLELTATELWDLCARLHGRIAGDPAAMSARAVRLARRLGLDPPARPLREYSHGMRRKTQLTAALLHDPPVVVLDEPTNGLDPPSSYQLGLILGERAATVGTAVLVTTHDLMWALRFADVLSVMTEGAIAVSGPPAEILDAEAVAAVGQVFDDLVAGLQP